MEMPLVHERLVRRPDQNQNDPLLANEHKASTAGSMISRKPREDLRIYQRSEPGARGAKKIRSYTDDLAWTPVSLTLHGAFVVCIIPRSCVRIKKVVYHSPRALQTCIAILPVLVISSRIEVCNTSRICPADK